MTVKQLYENMTLREFMYWGIYWGRRGQEAELANMALKQR